MFPVSLFTAEENHLKPVSRIFALFLITILAILMTGCQSGPKHDYPMTLVHARELESKDPPVAYDEFLDVSNKLSPTDKEGAAAAMLEGAQFAMDPLRYGIVSGFKPGTPGLSKEVLESIKNRQTEGFDKAHEALKTLEKNYGSTKVVLKAKQERVRETLEESIDKRNSVQLSYKAIDFLVNMTGAKEGFSYWFALVLIAVFVKSVTLPLSLMMYKSQREMQRIQPALKALNESLKDDPQEMQKRQAAFYKEHNVNPFATCLPMLIQIPFMIWVYNTIRLYEFHFAKGTFLWVGKLQHLAPGNIGANLGEFDMALLIIYCLTMIATMLLTPAPDPQQAATQKQTSIMMTIMMFYFFNQSRWSSAFILYWIVLNILAAGQSYYFVYRPNKLNPVVPLPISNVMKASSEKKDPQKPGGGSPKKLTPAQQGAAGSGNSSNQARRPRKPRR